MRNIRANWRAAILVCRKCEKRGHDKLAKRLRKYIGAKKGRKSALGVVEVGCLGVCPKGAITVVDGARPGEWLLVKAGAPIEEVAAALAAPPA